MPPPRSGLRGTARSGSRRQRRKQQMRRVLLWTGGGLLALILLPLLVIGAAIALIDPASYKARIQAASLQSFGRELTIRGNVSVSASLSPTLIAEDVSLANAPWGTRADMVRIDQLEVQLSPSALLAGRFVIVRLVLLRPDILLETDAEGRANWRFGAATAVAPPPPPPPIAAAAARPGLSSMSLTSAGSAPIPQPPAPVATAPTAGVPAPAAASASTEPSARGPALSLETLHVRDGRVTWHDGRSGRTDVFDVRRVSATAANADAAVAIGAEVYYGRQRIGISGQTGPLSRLQDTKAQSPWGVFVNLDVTGAKLTVAGSLTRPLEGRGYSFRLDGAIRDLGQLSWLSPVDLPPLHNITVTAKLLDQGTPMPDISSVVIQAGLTNLDKVSPGFTLETARLEMPRLSEPVLATAEGTYAGSPLLVKANIGAPALLMGAAAGTVMGSGVFGIDATAEAGGSTLAVRGAMLDPAHYRQMDFALGARVADLSILSPLFGIRLPPIHTAAFTAHLVDPPPGGPLGFTLRDAVLTIPEGDLGGDATLLFGARPSLQATLQSTRIDADAVLAVLATPGRAEPRAPQPRRDPSVAEVITPQAVPRRGTTIISEAPIPLEPLAGGNLDLRLAVGELHAAGNVFHDLSGRAVLQDGRLVLDPVRADVPGGRLALRASIDSTLDAAPMAFSLRAPSLDLRPLLAAFGLGDLAAGKLFAEADLHAAGRSPHALAATLDGRLGLALTDAEVDNSVVGAALGEVLGAARLSALLNDSATTKLRCLALRLDSAKGNVTLGPAVLDSPRLLVGAAGRLDLGNETLAMQLRPMLRGGLGVAVPLRVDGSFREPRVTLDSSGAMQSALSAVTGRLGGAAANMGGDPCAPALASIRGSAPALADAAAPAK